MKLATQLAIALALTLSATAADVADMSGAWKLNVKKSKFEKNAAPLNVLLTIQHQEPTLKYSGSVVGSQEGHPDTFEFDGAIDEKIYPVKENAKSGRTIKFKRVNDRTVESWSSDATGMEEYAKTSVQRDGKTMVREMTVKDKNRQTKRSWTEYYDKQS
jgi:hypothetical protein